VDLATGAGPVASIAADSGLGVHVADIAVDADLSDTGVDTTGKVRCSSGRIDVEDALTAQEVDAALVSGRRLADAEVDAGADLLIGALCGVGASTATAVVAAGLTGMEPVEVTSRGSGINDAAWIRKVAAVRDALYRTRMAGTDAWTMLRVAGGADLAALTGFLAQAAVRGVPVLVDDVPSTTAALLANRLAPGSDAYVVVTSLSPERSHRRLLDLLGRDPLTAWSLRLGDGVGAALIVPVVRAVTRSAGTGDADAGGARTADAVDTWDPSLF
jgi:nicotinate-nucleotide--dimethylbenzimidazole phosphoribosyltransferase